MAPRESCGRRAAANASRSAFRTAGARETYRSVTSDIDASILVSRLSALFAFMIEPCRLILDGGGGYSRGSNRSRRRGRRKQSQPEGRKLFIIPESGEGGQRT